MDYGDRVSSSKIYQRDMKSGQFKYWREVEQKISNGIYLGTRQLQNGLRKLDEYGYTFHPIERFTAALVSPGKNINPVYVPLDSVFALQENNQ